MVTRLLTTAACAVGMSCLFAPAALAATQSSLLPQRAVSAAEQSSRLPQPWEVKPFAVQAWTPKGLHHVIECPTLTAHPACDSRRWPANVFEVMEGWGGYRSLTRTGNWYEYGGYEETFAKIEEADERGLEGAAKMEWSPYALDLLEGRTDPLSALIG